MKPKAQTLQQRMGFFDEELSKPKHDELMIWLDSNIEEIINEIFNAPLNEQSLVSFQNNCEQQINEVVKNLNEQISHYQDALTGKGNISFHFSNDSRVNDPKMLQESIERRQNKLVYLQHLDLFSNMPETPRIKSIKKKWEFPVTTQQGFSSSNKHTVGFIDFVASFNIPTIFLEGLKFEKNDLNNKYTAYDIEDSLRVNYRPLSKTVYIEVKTEIKSIGELMRQINHYKTYLPGDYYVLCPNDEHRKILESQQIGFINYK